MLLLALACASDPTNVVVIIMDDVGTEQIMVYGEGRKVETPSIDALAEEGMIFDRAYATPVCSPSRVALLTGNYPRRYGIGRVLFDGQPEELDTRAEVLPELRGGASAAVGKWHLATPTSEHSYDHPNASGFDHFAGSLGNLGGNKGATDYLRWNKLVDGELEPVEDQHATVVTVDDALDAMADMPEPWTLYVAFNAAHRPFDPPPGANLPSDATRRQRYEAMVTHVDQELGRLFDAVDLSDTHVVFTADNGPPGLRKTNRLSKGSLYEPGVRVPLIVAGPEVTRGRSSALVHLVDVVPTLLDLSHLEERDLDGVSFAPVLRGQSNAARDVVYNETFARNGPPPYLGDRRSVVNERYKLIRLDTSGLGSREQFFDLHHGEKDDRWRGYNLVWFGTDDLSPTEYAAYVSLSAELDRYEDELRYLY